MNNFLNGLVKLFGFSDWGLTSLIYSIYLKRTKLNVLKKSHMLKKKQ